MRPEAEYWFGGGKLAIDQNNVIWLSGRYRNAGDSRTGLEAGARGAELALFRSDDGGKRFSKVRSWSKADLSTEDREVISIEGTALHYRSDGKWELFVSSEKKLQYPEEVRHYQKSGTGVWTIDMMLGSHPEALKIETLEPVLENLVDPTCLHIKDPFVIDRKDGSTILVFCSHPFSWTSDNTGYALRKPNTETFKVITSQMVPRGPAWDVAVTRITSRLSIPQIGVFVESKPVSVYLYDGAECMRAHRENTRAIQRPRGYSCEEIGGAFWGWTEEFPAMERLSTLEPLFFSPWGSGSSRYVDSLVTKDGILAVWQQSQKDGSQALVRHFLPNSEVARILSQN
jgi:hypothetical protein